MIARVANEEKITMNYCDKTIYPNALYKILVIQINHTEVQNVVPLNIINLKRVFCIHFCKQ